MPATSKAQFAAMEAAAHGKSTLGIPKSVGQEFVAATSKPSELPARVHAGRHHDPMGAHKKNVYPHGKAVNKGPIC